MSKKAYNDINVWQRLKNGDGEARDELMEDCMELAESQVHTIVNWLEKKGETIDVPMEDLIQEGKAAMSRAIEKFDPTFGARFTDYAKNYYVLRAVVNRIK